MLQSSEDALENPLVKRILPRYVAVAKDNLPANFQIAKRTEFKFSSMSARQMWDEHTRLTKKFYDTKKSVDAGKIKIEDLKLPRFSLLDLKIMLTKDIMRSCHLCERRCHANRLEGEEGSCKVGSKPIISSEFIHMGEEPYITPSHTIFFMGCTMQCQFCQNYTISQWYESGYPVTAEQMAETIEKRKIEGSRNVNFVGGEPTPHLLWILETLKSCKVNIPIIWNSNFYMSKESMRILDSIVDMHLSDFKYGNSDCASRLSKVKNYFDVCSRNHSIAARRTEMTVRHLMLPKHVDCCTKPTLDWIAKKIKNRCLVNLMDQYRPDYKASGQKDINRKLNKEEFVAAVEHAKKLGINFIT